MNEQDSFESAVAAAQIEYDQRTEAGDWFGAACAQGVAANLLEILPF